MELDWAVVERLLVEQVTSLNEFEHNSDLTVPTSTFSADHSANFIQGTEKKKISDKYVRDKQLSKSPSFSHFLPVNNWLHQSMTASCYILVTGNLLGGTLPDSTNRNAHISRCQKRRVGRAGVKSGCSDNRQPCGSQSWAGARLIDILMPKRYRRVLNQRR